HEIEYALRQQRWREIQEVWRRIEWQRKRKLRRRGKLFNKFERNYRGCSDASPKFFGGPFALGRIANSERTSPSASALSSQVPFPPLARWSGPPSAEFVRA